MRAVTNPSEVESRSSRRRTRTLRNTFNLEANNQLSQIFSNYFEATAIIQHQHQPYTAIGEQQKAEYKEFNLVIQQQNDRKNKSNQIMKEISVAKDELIKSLEQNNRKITYEVQAIWEKIHSISVVKQPTKKHRKLIQEQLNSQKLQKDLQNAYKRIKIAEKQMKSYRNRQQKSTDFVDKLKKLKKDLSEREVIAHRIKGQIAARNIELKQAEKIITIKLNEKSGQGQFKKLSEELNYLLSLVKETQKREQQKINTLKKQYVSVKKIQRELVEKGMSEFQLQQIKKQCMRQFPTKKQLQQKIHSKNEAFKQDKRKQKVEQKERNSKNFNQMVNQVALLQKKQTQFERQYEKIRATKLQYAELNKNLQQKIRSCQIESQQLENLNQKLRSKHIQQHRAKKSQNAEKQLTQIITIPLRSSWKTKQQQILLKQKNKRYKSLPHDLDILTTQPKEEKNKKGVALFGGGSIGCHKFSDKYTLANENRNKKIIGLVVYFQPQRNFISGISVIYEEGIKGGDYVWRLSETQQQYKIQSIQFDQVYVKEIIPNFEKKNTKFKLVGIQLLLSDRTVKKIGKVVNQKGKLQQKEYVSCLHGSMSILTQNGKHVSVIQQLGYQIYQ